MYSQKVSSAYLQLIRFLCLGDFYDIDYRVLKNVYLWLTLYAFQNLFGVLRNALLSVLVSFCANSAEKQGQCTE